jgi:subtilase family serine protease
VHLRKNRRLSRRSRLTAVALPVGMAAVALGMAAPAQAAGPVAYPGSVPSWATHANDAGAAAPDTTVEGEIYLQLKDLKGATALATAVSTPGSKQYHQFVSPQQWIKKYGPDAASYAQLVSFLKAEHLTVTGTPKSRLFVVFRGTSAQVGSAFGTAIRDYRVAGKQLAAPTSAPALPSTLAPLVSAIELDQGRLLTRPDSATAQPKADGDATSPAKTTAAASQCSSYYDQYEATLPQAYGKTSFPTYLCGYTPAQLRSAYGVTSASNQAVASTKKPSNALTGAGQTVAIIDAYASPTIQADVNQYSANRHEPALTGYKQIVPKTFYDEAACAYPSGWQGEQTLDVEAVHGIAPKADVLYVGGFNCGGGIDVALSTILDDKLANIVSNSYGDEGELVPADAIQGQENQHLQAAAEGIGLYYSSGDDGDESINGLAPQPDYEASSPWVTAVGGTSTGITKNGTVGVETGWGSHRVQDVNGVYEAPAPGTTTLVPTAPPGPFRFGAGGGPSHVFDQPAYQRGIVPNSLAGGKRVSPDIAADADPYTGFLIGYRPITDDATLTTGAYAESAIGGTSLASPLVAAQMALVQQTTGFTIGFANPALYALYRVAPAAIRDVSTTTPFPLAFGNATTKATYLVTGNEDSSLKVTKGYDDVTGLGAISFTALRRIVGS